MWNTIEDPSNGKKIKINSKRGNVILNKYIIALQTGGHKGPCALSSTSGRCVKSKIGDDNCFLSKGRCKLVPHRSKVAKKRRSKPKKSSSYINVTVVFYNKLSKWREAEFYFALNRAFSNYIIGRGLFDVLDSTTIAELKKIIITALVNTLSEMLGEPNDSAIEEYTEVLRYKLKQAGDILLTWNGSVVSVPKNEVVLADLPRHSGEMGGGTNCEVGIILDL